MSGGSDLAPRAIRNFVVSTLLADIMLWSTSSSAWQCGLMRYGCRTRRSVGAAVQGVVSRSCPRQVRYAFTCDLSARSHAQASSHVSPEWVTEASMVAQSTNLIVAYSLCQSCCAQINFALPSLTAFAFTCQPLMCARQVQTPCLPSLYSRHDEVSALPPML